jgi:hypothetical protein
MELFMIKDRVADLQPLKRLPGLFRSRDFVDVIESGKIYLFEEAGSKLDGTPLFEIYVGTYREPSPDLPSWMWDAR